MYAPFTRTKIINGHAYLYEITPYWDFETGRLRQKSKYLSKVVETTSSSRKTKPSTPKRYVDFGDAYLIQKLIEELTLDNLLKQCFTEEVTNMILLASSYNLLTDTPFSMMESWTSSTDLGSTYPAPSLSTQAIANYLEKLGQDKEGNISNFLSLWSQQFPIKNDNWLFNLTTSAQQKRAMNGLSYEQAQLVDDLPLLNMGLLMNQNKKLPIYYQLYPITSKNISILEQINKDARLLSIPTPKFILDQEFYNLTNLAALFNSSFEYILSIPVINDPISHEIIMNHHQSLASASNLQIIGLHMCECLQGDMTIPETFPNSKRKYIKYTLIRDYHQQQRNHENFLRELLNVEETLLATLQSLQWASNPTKTVLQKQKKQWMSLTKVWGSFLNPVWNANINAYYLERDDFTISLAKAEAGIMIWHHTHSILPKEILSIYEERESLEILFYSSKNKLTGLPLEDHENNVLQGLYFILFITMILQYLLQEKIRQSKLAERYSLVLVFLELRKIKKTVDSAKSNELSEITNTQKEIFEQLKIDLPKSC